ncbi:hypothetical protein MTR67_043649 [Solanum verrucosum]|uniref:Uncharacterized protein n=1 Tax=Solanum verrucosum TaxID=315347 RepID=A0AAF0US21_SOLVR|nr:hypothetical protein MTR67_043649 [Solanum verrucosum]
MQKLKNPRDPNTNFEDETLWNFNLSIVVLWVIGRHGMALQNFSVMRQLLSFSAELILSFKTQHTGTKGEVKPFGDSPSRPDDP